MSTEIPAPLAQLPQHRSGNGTAILVEVGAERGVPTERILRGTGLTEWDLRDTTVDIEPWQEFSAGRNLVAAAGEPGLGLIAGTRHHINSYGVWGFALISSPTVRDAIRVGLRYLALTSAFCRMTLEEDAVEARFCFDPAAIPADVRTLFVERDTAAAFTLFQEMLPGAEPLRWDFAYPAPRCVQRYQETFGVPTEFEVARTYAVLDPGLLASPLPRANERIARRYEERCRQLLDRRNPGSPLLNRIRILLLRTPDRLPSMDDVAAQLNMGTRTLRRRLTEEGTSFRGVLADFRMELAEELLRTGVTVKDVGQRLGYSDPASFHRAFRSRTGMAPGQYARRIR
ncbi:AraC family transcriptional regulator [Nocardia arthritidis]|uniref:Helix-turn-helix domain-containing protein n=1 Tax=Nocardia arthritidis TaxID=228602 RepID=A0A6G9YLI7_9NOCA|nr:AraC family transcriptional regulator [Nocardia arthritidis]QIS14068.1 helix-turn-helix domain-containing protein [Nocardia arthritidis]